MRTSGLVQHTVTVQHVMAWHEPKPQNTTSLVRWLSSMATAGHDCRRALNQATSSHKAS